mmetsp:Transcript_63730/g.137035  ORF Transcript_63730/g.137035 Transcript_63730/m.137035 type:complete len:1283 (+) Transcript_63730:98-3946(+)
MPGLAYFPLSSLLILVAALLPADAATVPAGGTAAAAAAAEGRDSGTSPQPSSAKNVALGRPCEPAPPCRALLDGRRSSSGRGSGSDMANGTGVTTRNGGLDKGAFQVFLKERVFVTQVIIFCNPVLGGKNGTGGLHRRKLVVVTRGEPSSGDHSSGETRREHEVLVGPRQPGGCQGSVQLGEAAVTVAVSTVAAGDLDGGFEITEVAVMALPLAAGAGAAITDATLAEMAAARPLQPSQGDDAGLAARPGAVERPPARSLPGALRGSSMRTEAVAAADEKPLLAASIGDSTDPGFLTADRPGASFTASVAAAYISGLVSFVSVSIMAVMVLTKARCMLTKGLQEGGYDRLPVAEAEEPLITDSVNPCIMGAPSVAFRWFAAPPSLGPSAPDHEEDVEAAEPRWGILPRSRSENQVELLSRNPVPEAHYPSEPEPEGELDPGGSGSSEAEMPMTGASPPQLPRVAPAVPDRPACPSEVAASARGRVVMLYASPLCYRDPEHGPTPMPTLPFEREWEVLMQAHDLAAAALREAAAPGHPGTGTATPGGGLGRATRWRRPGVSLAAQPLTAGSLQRALAPVAAGGAARVLHISAHGARNCLVLEDSADQRPLTAHLLSCGQLREMLQLRGISAGQGGSSGVRLVLLNACSLRAAGAEFAESGVPHVIGSSASLRDSASCVFLRALYGSLFQGSSVVRAFEAGRVALRSDAEAATRAAAEDFYLLPEGADHAEVLFQLQSKHLAASAAAEARQLPAAAKESSLHLGPPGQEECTLGHGHSSSDGEGSSSPREAGRRSGGSSDSGGSLGSGSLEDGWGTTSSGEEEGAMQRLTSGLRTAASSAAGRCQQLGNAMAAPLGSGRSGVTGERSPRPVAPQLPRRSRGTSEQSVQMSAAAVLSPFGKVGCATPEDFLGRALDAWVVLQHLSARRAVVLCGAPGEDHGVGKSAVLDAVHRAFVLQMGGVCVHVRSLGKVAVGGGGACWIETATAAVRAVSRECQTQWWPGATPRSLAWGRSRGGSGPLVRRRGSLAREGAGGGGLAKVLAVRPGFHPLSDPLATAPALEELAAELAALAELCEARSREWPTATGRILFILDDCDHLIQQAHFQDAVENLLHRCAVCSVILSTQQRMVRAAGGQFKVVQHELRGLAPRDAARLFLRRAQRPLRWGELLSYAGGSNQKLDPQDPVVMTKENEGAVLDIVASLPCMAALRGNPRRIIELAGNVGPSLLSLSHLVSPPLRQPPLAEERPQPQQWAGQQQEACDEEEEEDEGESAPLLFLPVSVACR